MINFNKLKKKDEKTTSNGDSKRTVKEKKINNKRRRVKSKCRHFLGLNELFFITFFREKKKRRIKLDHALFLLHRARKRNELFHLNQRQLKVKKNRGRFSIKKKKRYGLRKKFRKILKRKKKIKFKRRLFVFDTRFAIKKKLERGQKRLRLKKRRRVSRSKSIKLHKVRIKDYKVGNKQKSDKEFYLNPIYKFSKCKDFLQKNKQKKKKSLKNEVPEYTLSDLIADKQFMSTELGKMEKKYSINNFRKRNRIEYFTDNIDKTKKYKKNVPFCFRAYHKNYKVPYHLKTRRKIRFRKKRVGKWAKFIREKKKRYYHPYFKGFNFGLIVKSTMLLLKERPYQPYLLTATKRKYLKKLRYKKPIDHTLVYKKIKRPFRYGKIIVKFKCNNMFVSLVNKKHKLIHNISSGANGFKGPKRNTRYAKERLTAAIAKKSFSLNYKVIDLHFKSRLKRRLKNIMRGFGESRICVRMVSCYRSPAHGFLRAKKLRRL